VGSNLSQSMDVWCVYAFVREVVGLERGPLSYLNEKVAAPVLKTEINGRGNPLR
jgi:hypothetical protein